MPSSVETAVSVKSPRRGGQFVSFLPDSPLRRCPWDVVEQHTCDDALRRQVAGSATLGFLRRGSGSPSFLPVGRAAQLRPAMLDGCRMPASHQGMPNFIGIVVVPDLDGRRRPVWFESFNELTHLLDLIIESGVAAVATQPFRLQWTLARAGRPLHRSHRPSVRLRRSADRGWWIVPTGSHRPRACKDECRSAVRGRRDLLGGVRARLDGGRRTTGPG